MMPLLIPLPCCELRAAINTLQSASWTDQESISNCFIFKSWPILQPICRNGDAYRPCLPATVPLCAMMIVYWLASSGSIGTRFSFSSHGRTSKISIWILLNCVCVRSVCVCVTSSFLARMRGEGVTHGQLLKQYETQGMKASPYYTPVPFHKNSSDKHFCSTRRIPVFGRSWCMLQPFCAWHSSSRLPKLSECQRNLFLHFVHIGLLRALHIFRLKAR